MNSEVWPLAEGLENSNEINSIDEMTILTPVKLDLALVPAVLLSPHSHRLPSSLTFLLPSHCFSLPSFFRRRLFIYSSKDIPQSYPIISDLASWDIFDGSWVLYHHARPSLSTWLLPFCRCIKILPSFCFRKFSLFIAAADSTEVHHIRQTSDHISGTVEGTDRTVFMSSCHCCSWWFEIKHRLLYLKRWLMVWDKQGKMREPKTTLFWCFPYRNLTLQPWNVN